MAIAEILTTILTGIISFFISALFLMFSTKLFKTPKNTYVTALKVILWAGVISVIAGIINTFVTNETATFVVAIIAGIMGIIIVFMKMRTNYGTGIWRSFLILLVSLILEAIVVFVVLAILAVIFTGSFATLI